MVLCCRMGFQVGSLGLARILVMMVIVIMTMNMMMTATVCAEWVSLDLQGLSLTTTCRCSLVTTRTAEHTASPFLTISRSQLALEEMSSVRDFNKPIFLKATKLITCAEVVVPPCQQSPTTMTSKQLPTYQGYHTAGSHWLSSNILLRFNHQESHIWSEDDSRYLLVLLLLHLLLETLKNCHLLLLIQGNHVPGRNSPLPHLLLP